MSTSTNPSSLDHLQHNAEEQVESLIKEKEALLENENYLKCVNAFARDLFKAETIDDVLWIITTYIIEEFDFVDCVVYLLDEDSGYMQKVASHSVASKEERVVKHPITIQVGEGIVGSVAKSGKAEIVGNTRNDPRYLVDDAVRLSELTVPILSDGKVIGIIDSEHEQENFFNDGHMETLIAISNLSAIKIENLYVLERERLHSRELERVNSELDRFVYHVTHDLKSPLSSLLGMMFLIKRETDLEVLSTFYERMEISMNQMSEFIDEILSYSQNAHAALNLARIDIKSLMKKVIESHRYQENVHIIKFTTKIEQSLMIETDENRLRIIMNNLLSNAIKYHDPEKEQPSIFIEAKEKNGVAEIIVEDNGLGMSPSEKNKIFDMFYRIPRKGSTVSGTGVGLYILKETVQKLGGEIKVSSKKGVGSKFTLIIPLRVSN